MSDIAKNLEEQANLLFENVAGWDTRALQRIGKRIKSIEKMSMADLQGINNAVWVRQDFDAIMRELATVMEMSASEVEDIYSNMVDEQHEADRPLYDYRNKAFKPLSDNRRMKAMVRAFSKATAKSMIGLSRTKATGIGFVDKNNKFVSFEKDYKKILDKAIMSITTGTGDFHSEMREVLKELGGSGLRFDYGGGVTRRLDSMVRQNLLFGAKQVSVEYSEMIGEELECDGIEIDWHSNPRPAHEFMQGKQFSLHGKKTIKGVTYEDAGKALKALSDYGCLHFKTPIILGVSRPRFDPEELERLTRENSKLIEIDGVKKTGYGWKQTMRRLETEARKTRDQIEILKASGDKEGVKQLRGRLKAVNEKYATVAKATGIKPQYEKMAVVKGASTKGTVVAEETTFVSRKMETNSLSVDRAVVNTKIFHDKFEAVGVHKSSREATYQEAMRMLEHRDGTECEDIVAIDARSGAIVVKNTASQQKGKTGFTEEQYKEYLAYEGKVVLLHNHPNGSRPSFTDISTLFSQEKVVCSVTVGHDGSVHIISKPRKGIDIDKIYKSAYNEYKEIYKESEMAKIKALDDLYALGLFEYVRM